MNQAIFVIPASKWTEQQGCWEPWERTIEGFKDRVLRWPFGYLYRALHGIHGWKTDQRTRTRAYRTAPASLRGVEYYVRTTRDYEWELPRTRVHGRAKWMGLHYIGGWAKGWDGTFAPDVSPLELEAAKKRALPFT